VLRFDVFGRLIGVVRRDDRWEAFLLGSEGKKRVLPSPIPADVPRDGLRRFLADLYHESARPDRPDVVELEPEPDEDPTPE